MPKLQRQQYCDLVRDMNWHFTYVREEDVFPEEQCQSLGIPSEGMVGVG